jgi:Acetyltransferase (GNAT) domain
LIGCREVSGSAWDALLHMFRDAVHEQSFAYSAARWGERRVCCVIVERNGSKLGGAVAVAVRVLGRGFAAIKFGPLYRRGASGDGEHARDVVREIKSFFCKERKLHLSILPQAALEGDMLVDALAEAGFREGERIGDPRRYFIDLSRSEAEMRGGLAQRWRRNLKLAEKQELHVKELPGESGLPIFRRLFDELKARKQAVDATGLKEMTALNGSPRTELRPRVFLAQRSGGDALAGAIVTIIGERAVFAFGAQNAEGAAINATYALQWAIVDRLRREERCRWYDLGGDAHARGLVQFKTGFVGKTGQIAMIPAKREYSENALSELVAKAAHALKR